MRVYDISQEVFSCAVYEGDISPTCDRVKDYVKGDVYALSNFTMCAHNGTHIDAPRHFIDGGDTVDKIPLECFIGKCRVSTVSGDVTADTFSAILRDGDERLCLRGDAIITEDGADYLIKRGIKLIGVEGQSVSDPDAPMRVHTVLLRAGVMILEGLRLSDVPDGEYFLFSAPLNLGGCEGAPCRAVLIDGII